MYRYQPIKTICALGFIAIGLNACRSPVSLNPECVLPETTTAQIVNTEEQGEQTASTQVVPDPKLDISLYVDGSGSMLGYVQSRDSYYGEALKTLGDILALDRGLRAIKPEVSYFRIGQENPAIDRSGFRQAELPGFYDGTNSLFPEVSSPIHEAIKPPSGDKDLDNLIVIVTDLEQDDGDVTKLTSNLQQHYLNQNKRYAVGVWAVKSEFAGKIYLNSTQGGLQVRNYDTKTQTSDRYRPFYVLFVGPTADVAHYFEKIAAKTPDLTNGSQGYLTLFPSDRLTEPLISLNEPKEMGGDLTQPDLITGKGVVVENEGNNPYQLFQILPNGASEQSLTFEVPVNKVPYSLAFEPTSLGSTIAVQVFDSYSQFETNNDPNLALALKIEDLKLTPSQEQLTIVSKLNTDAIDYDGAYLYQAKIGVESLETPIWWQDWSWQKVNDQDGARTQNFARFMTQLKDISFDLMADKENAGATVGLLCYGIQK